MSRVLIKTQRPRSARFSVIAALSAMMSVWRQRQQLRRLDDRMLRDIGVTRSEAESEADRSVWNAPETWCG